MKPRRARFLITYTVTSRSYWFAAPRPTPPTSGEAGTVRGSAFVSVVECGVNGLPV